MTGDKLQPPPSPASPNVRFALRREHDGGGNRSETVAALKIVIPRLLATGYHFRTP